MATTRLDNSSRAEQSRDSERSCHRKNFSSLDFYVQDPAVNCQWTSTEHLQWVHLQISNSEAQDEHVFRLINRINGCKHVLEMTKNKLSSTRLKFPLKNDYAMIYFQAGVGSDVTIFLHAPYNMSTG
jgi:hypothetical protein